MQGSCIEPYITLPYSLNYSASYLPNAQRRCQGEHDFNDSVGSLQSWSRGGFNHVGPARKSKSALECWPVAKLNLNSGHRRIAFWPQSRAVSILQAPQFSIRFRILFIWAGNSALSGTEDPEMMKVFLVRCRVLPPPPPIALGSPWFLPRGGGA